MTSALYPWDGPMPIVVQTGAAREMGRTLGSACRRAVTIVADHAWQVLQSSQIGLSRQEIIAEVDALCDVVADCGGEDYLEEMAGMAEGAGLEEIDLRVLNCGFDLTLIYSDTQARAQDYSRFERLTDECSSFVAWDEATVDGHIIATHNSDGPRFPAQFQVCRLVRPTQGLPFISPTIVGRVGQHSMLNGAGLFLAGLALEAGIPKNGSRHGLPLPFVFRHIIQTCATVPEAVKTLGELPLVNAGNYLFADRERRVELVQATPKRQVSRQPDPNANTFHVTNHALSEEVKPYLVMRPDPSNTHYRYASLGRLLRDEHGVIDEQKARGIMSSHYDVSVSAVNPGENSLCRHHEYQGELGGTCRSSVWNLDAGTAEIALGNPCRENWVEIASFLNGS